MTTGEKPEGDRTLTGPFTAYYRWEHHPATAGLGAHPLSATDQHAAQVEAVAAVRTLGAGAVRIRVLDAHGELAMETFLPPA
jgi:hypothetical protein